MSKKITDLFAPKDRTERRHNEHSKQIKKIMKDDEKKLEKSHRRNECRILLRESEAGFKRVMDREVKNARTAKEIGIDYTLNKNQFSDAMRGIECIQRARWYLDSVSSDDSLHNTLRMLNQALKLMNKLDGEMRLCNTNSLRKRMSNLYELENLTEEDAVLPPTQEYKYKFENGLFENMVSGMSYDEARKASPQELNIGGTPVGTPNFGDIFAEEKQPEDEAAAARRREMLENRQREL